MIILGVIEIQKVAKSLKSKIRQAFKQDGYVAALRLYRQITDCGLKTAVDTVKPWCIKWGYKPYGGYSQ